ncbi:MAG TPA: TolC family protein [Acidobacteriota bacterium]
MRPFGPIGLLAGALAAAPLPAEPLSRAQAVAAALQAHPEIQKAQEEIRKLGGQILEARADALPEVTLTGTALRFRDPSLLNSSSFDAFPPELRDSLTPIPANLFGSAVSVRQTLLSFKLGKAIEAARLGVELGAEELRRVRQEIALEAIRAYNDFVLSLEQVEVAGKSVRQKEEHLAAARNRRSAGVATDLDVLRSQVDVENQRAQLLRFRGLADLARGRLNAVMVHPIAAPIQPSDGLDFMPLDLSLNQAIQEAWSNRPESKAIALTEGLSEKLIGIEAAEMRPSVDFDGQWGTSVRQPENFFDSDFTQWSAGVTVTVPLFDGLRSAGRVSQARAQRNQVIQDRIALENQIRLEAKDAVDRLAVARSILEAAELNQTQAQRALDMTQANYKYGAATTLDVLDAQAALTLAESTRILALHEHANARATLRYVMARDPLDPPAGGGAPGATDP